MKLKIAFLVLALFLVASFVSAKEVVMDSTIKEQVKCVFANSNEMQKCYTDNGQFGCSGTGTCVADVSGEKGMKQTWKSSCGGYAYTIIDGDNDYAEFKCESTGPPVIVKEQVKCVFANSNEMQKCYTDNGQFGCSGTGTCVADVSGEKGMKQTWKSSCGGYAYTIIDGDNDYAEFKCTESNETISIAKEQVKCIFNKNFVVTEQNKNLVTDKNLVTEQKCYTAEDNSRFSCSGKEACVMDISGEKGEKLTWKSSCGGYAYTLTDGDNEYAEFSCVPESIVTEEIISGKGFRYAYWQCYGGAEEKQGSESSCKSSETWQSYAKKFCDGHCGKDEDACGINSFSVTEECYLDFEKPEVTFIPSVEEEEKKTEITIEGKKEEILICKDSCPLEGKCYPFGYRSKGTFCSSTGSFVEQLKEESQCENNFECTSNVCVNNECLSSGLIEKILNWFKKII